MQQNRLAGGLWLSLVITVAALVSGCGGAGTTTAPPTGKPLGTSSAPSVVTTLDHSRLKASLPGLQNMPTGWKAGATRLQGGDTPADAPCRKPKGICVGKISHARVQYDNPESTGTVHIEANSYESIETAQSGYEERKASYADKRDREISMPRVGDESIARTGFHQLSGHPFVSIVMRVGTVVVAMGYTHEGKAPAPATLSLARMQAERLQQAQRGETPTAGAR